MVIVPLFSIMPDQPIVSLELPGVAKLRSGKVREVFDLGESLLFVATDRLSAFDVILPDPIPDKGAVLNQISAFWFRKFSGTKNHFITSDFSQFPEMLHPYRSQLEGRAMLVRKTKPLPVEGLPGHGRGLWTPIAARSPARLRIARTYFYSLDQKRGRA